jgi:two-component system response regulator FixJ
MEIQETVYLIDEIWESRRALASRVAGWGTEAWPFPDRETFLSAASRLRLAPLLLAVPDPSALDVMDALAEQGMRFPVIAIAAGCDVACAVAAMKLGAVDVIDREDHTDRLARALDEARRRIAETEEAYTACSIAQERVARLTPRERDVVRALLAGKRNKMVAYELGISIRTVEMHRAHLLAKLGARNLAQAATMLTAAGDLRKAS